MLYPTSVCFIYVYYCQSRKLFWVLLLFKVELYKVHKVARWSAVSAEFTNDRHTIQNSKLLLYCIVFSTFPDIKIAEKREISKLLFSSIVLVNFIFTDRAADIKLYIHVSCSGHQTLYSRIVQRTSIRGALMIILVHNITVLNVI